MLERASDVAALLVVPFVVELVAATPWFSSLRQCPRSRRIAIYVAGYVLILLLWAQYIPDNWRNTQLTASSLFAVPTIVIMALVFVSWVSRVLRSFLVKRTPLDRCDAHPDWYLDIPIADFRIECDTTRTTDASRSLSRELRLNSYWSDWMTLRVAHQGKSFTLDRFKRIQEELLTSSYFRDGPKKWGFDTLVYPAVPHETDADPTARIKENGCIGVGLWFIGRRYLSPRIRERPLRMVE